MISQLLRKWFNLPVQSCQSCEILRDQLEKVERDRSELLSRLLDKPKAEPLPEKTEEYKSIQPAFVPWRVRQQMLEQEDRKSAQLTRDRKQEIDELEKSLGIANDVGRGPSGGLKAEVK